MNLVKLQQLLSYDQPSNIQSVDCYLLNIPSTIRYPDPSTTDVASIIDTIQRNTFDAIDQIAWQHIRLILLEPSWLQSPQRVKSRQLIHATLKGNPTFIRSVLAHYEFVSLFQQTPFHQESLLLTATALQTLMGQINPEINASILEWSKSIIRQVIQSPNEWKLFIEGADWLMDELQLEEGLLYDFLHDITLAQTDPNAPDTAIEASIAHWIQQQKDSDIQALRDSLSRNEQSIQTLFENIERRHNKPKRS